MYVLSYIIQERKNIVYDKLRQHESTDLCTLPQCIVNSQETTVQ